MHLAFSIEDVNFTTTKIDFTYSPPQAEVTVSGGNMVVDFTATMGAPLELGE